MDKSQHINTIKSILDKAKDKAASESEAMNALKIAKKLMEKYNITDEDIKRGNVVIEDFVFGSNATSENYNCSSFERIVSVAIAKYTNTKVNTIKTKKVGSSYSNTKIVFFGHNIDVNLAVWMLNVCNDSLQYEWALYKNSITNKIHGNKLKSFSVGMAQRICERIFELIQEENEENINKSNTNANALVVTGNAMVLKNEIIDELYEKAMKGFGKPKRSLIMYNKDDSLKSGYKAGNNVSLHMATNNPVDEKMRIG